MGGDSIKKLLAGKNVFSAFLVFMMLFISNNACLIRTPDGQHCPTAPVQSVRDVVATSPSGDVCPTKIVPRKPKIGDSEFKQCLCAEKNAAEAQSSSTATEKVMVIVLMVPKPDSIVADSEFNLSVIVTIPQNVTEKTDVHGCPSTPPPNGLV